MDCLIPPRLVSMAKVISAMLFLPLRILSGHKPIQQRRMRQYAIARPSIPSIFSISEIAMWERRGCKEATLRRTTFMWRLHNPDPACSPQVEYQLQPKATIPVVSKWFDAMARYRLSGRVSIYPFGDLSVPAMKAKCFQPELLIDAKRNKV